MADKKKSAKLWFDFNGGLTRFPKELTTPGGLLWFDFNGGLTRLMVTGYQAFQAL